MKRVFVFSCYDHESQGGWNDCIHACETVEQAKKFVLSHPRGSGWYGQIVDVENRLIIETEGFCGGKVTFSNPQPFPEYLE